MENEEKKKKGIGKKVVLWIIGVIIVLFIIGCLDEDTAPTSSDVVEDSVNDVSSTNSVNNDLPSYVLETNGYTVFNMTISDFVQKLNETSTYNINPIEESEFIYSGEVPQQNGIVLKSYLYEQINPANGSKNGKGIVLQVDENGKIAIVRYLSTSGIYTDDVLLQRILNVTITAGKEDAQNIIEKATDNLGKPYTSEKGHYGYQYWKANNIPAFELFAM